MREREVLAACARLVAAANSVEIERILVSAVVRVIDVPCSIIFVFDHLKPAQQPTAAEARTLARGEAFFAKAAELSDGVRQALDSGEVCDTFSAADLSWLAHQVGRDDRVRAARLVPLALEGQVRNAFIVVAERSLSPDTVSAISTLASTSSIAFSRSILEGRYRALVHSSPAMIGVLQRGFRLSYASPAAAAFLGCSADESGIGRVGAGAEALQRLHEDDRELVRSLAMQAMEGLAVPARECRIRAHDGSWRDFEITFASLLEEPSVEGVVVTLRDITARKEVELQLRHQALHDPLTALANAALLRDRIEHAMQRRRRGALPTALLLFDLDEFKEVNDSLGHQAGDQALLHVTERVLGCIRADDTFARLGGDEFAILMDAENLDAAVLVARRIVEAVRTPIRLLRGDVVSLGASVGVVFDVGLGRSADEALRNADVAMYAAKRAGKSCVRTFSPAMHSDVVHRVRLEAALRNAVEHGLIEVHYQPIVGVHDGSLRALEALARWHDPERGPVPPAEFIPLAESTGLIVNLGRFVLEQACRTVACWSAEMPWLADLRVSVNVSPVQLEPGSFVDDVTLILERSGLRPNQLTLEITEGAVMRDTGRAVAALQALRRRGVEVAIDDFGTGHSSLGQLHSLPADVVKVDRSLVQTLSTHAGGEAVLQSIASLCRSLSLAMVVEGVEQEDELSVVRRIDPCAKVQGYIFAHPMAGAAMRTYLHAYSAAASSEPRPAA